MLPSPKLSPGMVAAFRLGNETVIAERLDDIKSWIMRVTAMKDYRLSDVSTNVVMTCVGDIIGIAEHYKNKIGGPIGR
jgi:hypothetical protein